MSDVENPDATDKQSSLLTSISWPISRWTKKIPQGEKKKSPNMCKPAHPQRSQNKVEKFSHGIDWL